MVSACSRCKKNKKEKTEKCLYLDTWINLVLSERIGPEENVETDQKTFKPLIGTKTEEFPGFMKQNPVISWFYVIIFVHSMTDMNLNWVK